MKKIKNLVDKMLVVFPFEEKLYKDCNVDAEFVGHPISERIEAYRFLSKQELFEKFNLDETKDILLLMPGSRSNEIEKLFPQMIKAGNRLAARFNLQIVVACSSNIDETIFSESSGFFNFKVVKDQPYDLMKYAKFGIIKSGTSTLEAACFSLPMLIVYKTSMLTYLIGKRLIKVENIGMANIILGERVVPELIQSNVSEKMIFETASKILNNNDYYNSLKAKLGSVKNKLGSSGASARAAKLIYELADEF
jgi:lipid-A-disaccharide synthase